MKPFIFVLITNFFLSFQSQASCENLDNLSLVKLPNGQNFRYRFLKGTNPSLPTVIYLPGGPGQGSINERDPRVSELYGFIQTDPRGVGCNSNLYNPNVNLSSNDLALDIVALIKKEKLSDYIIYGLSYGSALATIVAYHIENDPEIVNPQSLILEGVLGRAFEPHEEDRAILIEWEKYKEKAVLLDLFRSKEPQLGFNSLEIGQFIKGMLGYGLNPYNPEYYLLESYFNLLQQGSDEQKTLVDTIKGFNQPYQADLVQLYKQVGCEEFSSLGWKYDAYYVNGELVLDNSTKGICEGFPFVQGFDSANYNLRSKIYYFNGTNDPATPLWQAEYHIKNQHLAHKNIINVTGGGHNSLSYNLEDCAPELWELMLNNSDLSQSTLDSICVLQTMVE